MTNPIANPPTSQRDIVVWQRALWTVVPIVTLGLASWVPFVFWANRRNYGSGDQRWWIGFAVATAVEIILVATIRNDDNAASSLAGGYIIVLMLASAVMTWIKLAPKRM